MKKSRFAFLNPKSNFTRPCTSSSDGTSPYCSPPASTPTLTPKGTLRRNALWTFTSASSVTLAQRDLPSSPPQPQPGPKRPDTDLPHLCLPHLGGSGWLGKRPALCARSSGSPTLHKVERQVSKGGGGWGGERGPQVLHPGASSQQLISCLSSQGSASASASPSVSHDHDQLLHHNCRMSSSWAAPGTS